MINPAFYFKISYLYFFEIIIIMAVSGIVDESSCCFLHSCEIKTLNHNRYLANKIRFSTLIIVQQRMKKRTTCNFSLPPCFWIFDRRRIVIMTFDIIMMEENPIFAAVAIVSQWLMVNFLVKASVKFTCSPFHPSPPTKYYFVQIALSPLKSGHFLRCKFSFLVNSH